MAEIDGKESAKQTCSDCTLMKIEVDALKADLCTMNQKLDNLIDMNKNVAGVAQQMAEVKSFLVSIKEKQGRQDDVNDSLIKIQERLEGISVAEKGYDSHESQTSNHVGQETEVEGTEKRIIICGGVSESDTCEILMWSTKTWVPLQPMRCYRNSSSAFLYNNQVFVTGGRSGAKEIETLRINATDMTTEKWCSFTGGLPRGTTLHTTEVYNNTLFVIGGCSTRDDDVFDDIIYIDLNFPYIGRRATSMPYARFGHCSQLVGDKIFICGGSGSDCKHASGTILMYDVNKNKCSQVALMPYAVLGMAMVNYGSKLVAIGGLNPSQKALNTSFTYDIKTGKVEMLPPMNSERYYSTAVVVDNNIVVMGGSDDNGDALNTVEVFNFDSNSWQDFPSMTKPRSGSTAVKI